MNWTAAYYDAATGKVQLGDVISVSLETETSLLGFGGVLFPVKPALGAASFWGIPSDRNRFRYRADRSCISEYLPEKKEERKEKEGKDREESHHDHSYSAVRNHASDDGESDGGSPPAPSENGRRDR